ncbi:MAG: glucosaminidase domain-containing protein [Bacteroidales bacterium]|nr:glucosaminidase domain-containing protein [Bacteroidales bacterium]
MEDSRLSPNLPGIMVVIFFIIALAIMVVIANKISKKKNSEVQKIEHLEPTDSTAFADELLTYIFELRLEHPYIVFAQAIEESGHFKSIIFEENNNLFGMKMAWNRTTTAIGINRGHAVYTSWKQSVIDYAFFQMSYMRGLTREEYLIKLSNSYAENEQYVDNLQKILKRTNKS